MRYILLAVLVLAACSESPTYNAGRVLPQTEWSVYYWRFPDGTVESGYLSAMDTSGVSTLAYRVMCTRGSLESVSLDDPITKPGPATVRLESAATPAARQGQAVPTTAFPVAANGYRSAEMVGQPAHDFIEAARTAWTITVYHGDGTVHVWGAEKLDAAVATARAGCRSGAVEMR